jgi:hypothetical protein
MKRVIRKLKRKIRYELAPLDKLAREKGIDTSKLKKKKRPKVSKKIEGRIKGAQQGFDKDKKKK